MNGETPLVSIVIPVFNAVRYLPETIPAVTRAMHAFGRAELIVVDNGSTDGSWEWLREHVAHIAIVEQRPGHVGALRNHGVERARGAIIGFLDADCLIEPDYFDRAVAILERTHCIATGSRYALPDRPLWIERAWEQLHATRHDGEALYINSGNFVIRRAAFDAVGGFDGTLVSGEDAELCFRLRAAGYCLLESREVRAAHLGNPKTLGGFYRKQVWHGMGALGTARIVRVDKPLIMTVVHVLLSMLGAGVALFAPLPLSARVVWLLACFLATPVGAVAYRVIVGRTVAGALGAVPLYFLYFTARAAALGRLVLGRGRR